ncbi:MAG: GGDEF and EAL domain-containing protein [Candidatus Galacturonibacter soehngenii]|nr:GGDEF and EAL domain-containing protein [Candidatus Galacturonibacter soehngenii]
MKRERKFVCSLLGLFVLAVLLVSFRGSIVNGAEQPRKNVLFISSYTQSFMTVPDQISGIKKEFKNQPINLDMEFMDTKRFASDQNIKNFYTNLSFKIKNTEKYDAVIVGDDAALQFAIDYQEDLFSQIPIVFFGINDKDRAKEAAKNPYMTGIVEETSLDENIQLARKFNPTATKVAAIVDDTLTGKGDQKQFETAMQAFTDLDSIILNVSNYSFEEFAKVLEKIDENTILLFLSMNQDNTNHYMEMQDQYLFIKNHTKVPVYRASIGGVGEGLLGGRLISYEAFGQIAAGMVLDVFAGTPIDSIPLLEETPYYYFFDNQIIKKYKIDEALIPKEAVLVNKRINPLKEYMKYIVTVGVLILFLGCVAIILIIDNIKRRKIQRKLQESNEELSMIYEELAASEEELKMQYGLVEQHAKETDLLYQKYDIAITSTDSAVWELDVKTNELEVSSNIQNIVNKAIPIRGDFNYVLGYVIHPEYKEQVFNEIQNCITGKKDEVYIQVSDNAQDKRQRWFLIRGKGIHDKDNNLTKIYGIVLDTTSIIEKEEYIKHAASHDYLTDLPNRLRFMEVLEEELKKESSGAVLLFDIDDFKSINDTLGHVYGDELLKQIAARIRNIQDEKMYVARMGGDEFLILLKDVTDNQIVDLYIKRIKKMFSQVFMLGGREDFIHFSMGVTFYPMDSKNISQIIMNADTAMYKAKKSGKNSCIYYHEQMKEELKSKKKVEAILREAMKNDGFCLYYQPQIEVKTGEIIGFEALLRLKNHNISPDIFIPIAEERGYIIEIGRWVAKEAIRQMAEWIKKGYPEKMIAINYSGKQMRDKGFINYVKGLIQEYGMKPEYLEIEITEGIFFENNTQTLDFIKELRNQGFKIALDDFGTGYSSLYYLTYMPVDKIKLDKSIIDKFLEFENNKVMESLILLAHSLNLKITAEGIEEDNKLIKLKQNGCDYIQGYLFSKPLIHMDLEKIYNNNYKNYCAIN